MRIVDEYPFGRNTRSVVMRNATVTAVAADKSTVDFGELRGVPLVNGDGIAVGMNALVLLDRDNAVALSAYGAGAGSGVHRQTVSTVAGQKVVSFTVPPEVRSFRVEVIAKMVGGGVVDLMMRVNGSAEAHYVSQTMTRNGSGTNGGNSSIPGTSFPVGLLAGASDFNSISVVHVPLWNGATPGSLMYASVYSSLGSTLPNNLTGTGGGVYTGPLPYTTVDFLAGADVAFQAASRFELYGSLI